MTGLPKYKRHLRSPFDLTYRKRREMELAEADAKVTRLADYAARGARLREMAARLSLAFYPALDDGSAAPRCEGCGWPLVDGRCRYVGPEWPH